MAIIARSARVQIELLSDYYLRIDRPEAVRRLISAVQDARGEIDYPRMIRHRYPGVHRELVSLNLVWIKIHAYWFGYRVMPDQESAIANVIWDGADIPSRVEPFGGIQ